MGYMRIAITTTINSDFAKSMEQGKKKVTRVIGLEDMDISQILDFGIKFLRAERQTKRIGVGDYPENSQSARLEKAMNLLNGQQKQSVQERS